MANIAKIKRGARAWRTGHVAELCARLWLQMKGYTILRRNWRTPVGEVDILAARRDVLVIVEVKYRPRIADGAEAISPRQQQRLQRAMAYAAAAYPPYSTLRIDVMLLAPWRWP
ncbi:MAG: YraN family protein, partial [Alphaproteobacteria bacterium]|nr:YraN family protein [Alphaproteobacteria bacterium]